MRAPRQLSVASFAALLLTGALAGQGKVVSPAEKRARALVNQLELAERRVAAAEELLTLGGAAVPELAARLNDPRPEVVQVVCEVLCALGPAAAAALPQLATAIGSPNAAIACMVRLTEFRLRATGATTISEFDGRRIVQIVDGDDRVLLEGTHPWDFELLPDGHVLVSHYGDDKVVEYDGEGEAVWTFTGVDRPLDVDRLLDGRTLIADMGNERVIEVDAKGAVVWEWKTPPNHNPYDVERLVNGRTVVVLHPDLVVEVDRKGEVVWKLEKLDGVVDADRLPNGNTLLAFCHAGVVREVNGKGEVVWEAAVARPDDADRLPNGNTLVGTWRGVIEVGPDGKVVHEELRGKRVSEVTRH